MAETKTQNPLEEHLRPVDAPSADPAYLAWKRAKIAKALKESKDRSKMTPAHKVWEDLGLER